MPKPWKTPTLWHSHSTSGIHQRKECPWNSQGSQESLKHTNSCAKRLCIASVQSWDRRIQFYSEKTEVSKAIHSPGPHSEQQRAETKSRSSNSSTHSLTLLSTVHRGLKSCSSHFVIAQGPPQMSETEPEGLPTMAWCWPWYTMSKDRQPACKASLLSLTPNLPQEMELLKQMGDSNYPAAAE